jgi:hypothetical protein
MAQNITFSEISGSKLGMNASRASAKQYMHTRMLNMSLDMVDLGLLQVPPHLARHAIHHLTPLLVRHLCPSHPIVAA